MEQKIYDTKQFPFVNVDLGKPFNKNGMYFIKMYVNESPIYIQPPKCFIKQGVLKSGKKLFCDLVFSMEDNYFLTWLEKIEEIAKTRIFENRANWFETELDEHDIEQSLVSPYKMYKSGKYFILRTNLPTTLDKCDLKIYDENEHEINYEDLKEETNVITIIELKGIKCSARNFQFIFDVRQMLVIKPVKIFEKCIIKQESTSSAVGVVTSTYPSNKPDVSTIQPTDGGIAETTKNTSISTNIAGLVNEPSISMDNNRIQRIDLDDSNAKMNRHSSGNHITSTDSVNAIKEGIPGSSIDQHTMDGDGEPYLEEICDKSSSNETDYSPRQMNFVQPPIIDSPIVKNTLSITEGVRKENSSDTDKNIPNMRTELCEIDFDLAELDKNDVVQLKPRNDVYYKMYKAAKQKAKEAKLIALSSYLEAKRLKTTYSLDDSSDSSEDDYENEDENENDDSLVYNDSDT